MKKLGKSGVIYIYIIFLVTILFVNIYFISRYISGNIEIYKSIKNFYSLYGINRGLEEEIIVNYFDNSKNLNYIDTKYYDKNSFVSRYKDYIEYSLDDGDSYELSLTSLDEEYNNNLSKLKYIDLYWNTNDTKCNMDISLLKWDKIDINSILNNKLFLDYTKNVSLLNVVVQSDSQEKLKLYLSTGAYYQGGILTKDNFVLNNNTISSLSGTLGSSDYELSLNEEIDYNLTNTLNFKEKQVTDSQGNFFSSEKILIRRLSNIYTNRYRISDSFGDIDKKNYDYKILIKSQGICMFLIEGLDKDNKIIKIPANKLQGDFDVKEFNTKLSIDKLFNIGIYKLSNYLYKID